PVTTGQKAAVDSPAVDRPTSSANQAATPTTTPSTQSPAAPFLFLTPFKLGAAPSPEIVSLALLRANVLSEVDPAASVPPPKKTFEFAPSGGGGKLSEEEGEQLALPLNEPRASVPEAFAPGQLLLEGASPELGGGDQASGDEDGGPLVMAGARRGS